MRGPEHRRFDCHSGEVRPELHRLPGIDVARVEQDALEGVGQQPPCLVRKGFGEGCAACADSGLDRVSNRVDTSRGGHHGRCRNRQLRIEEGHAEGRRWVAARHLHPGLRICDDAVALRLAPRAGCRRDPDHRQQRRPGPAEPAVVGHLAAVGQQEVDALRAIE